MQDFAKIHLLKNAKNIAILGLSPDEKKASNMVARYLISQGYNIIPIYPKGEKILGKKAYANLQETFSDEVIQHNGEIDILNIFRKSEALEGIAKEILTLQHQPKCVWVQLGLHNETARQILLNAHIDYEENTCIKLEHQRLLG